MKSQSILYYTESPNKRISRRENEHTHYILYYKKDVQFLMPYPVLSYKNSIKPQYIVVVDRMKRFIKRSLWFRYTEKYGWISICNHAIFLRSYRIQTIFPIFMLLTPLWSQIITCKLTSFPRNKTVMWWKMYYNQKTWV